MLQPSVFQGHLCAISVAPEPRRPSLPPFLPPSLLPPCNILSCSLCCWYCCSWDNVISSPNSLFLKRLDAGSPWRTSSWSSPPCTFALNPWRRRFRETRGCSSSWSPFCRLTIRQQLCNIKRHTRPRGSAGPGPV